MIENDEQARKAQKEMTYWRNMAMGSSGSWLGNENARTEILRLRNEIAEYERRRAAESSASAAESPSIQSDSTTSSEG